MYLSSCVCCSILLMIADGLTVTGPSDPMVVPLGGSVLLPCSVDELLPLEDLEVEWKRSDTEILISLYQDGDVESLNNRAHFFTGNFSLLLKNVTTEDEGEYTCSVHSGQRSGQTVMEISLERVSFSTLHIIVLILCISACGSALLFCSLIYCSSNRDLRLQLCLIFCPNIILFFALVFWGITEGSVYETICCCALYILRPLTLIWTAPYVQQFKGNIKTWILNYSYRTEYGLFSVVLYSVLFHSAWRKGLTYTGFEGIMIIILFGFFLLLCVLCCILVSGEIFGKLSERMIKKFNVPAEMLFDALPSLQFVLLFYSFGSARDGFFIVAILPVILTLTNFNVDLICGQNIGCSPVVRRSVWSVLMVFVSAVMLFFYIKALENEKDHLGWVCMIGFLHFFWTIWIFSWSFNDKDFPRITIVYVFGSVGIVLFDAAGLMTELILKTVNGEGLMGDLRILIFSCESLFITSVLILLVFAPWIKLHLQSSETASETPATESNQNQESETNHLLNKQDTKDECQAESVETQT